jgi:hypothetical protein
MYIFFPVMPNFKENQMDFLKAECFANADLKFRKTYTSFFRFEKEYFSKQILDSLKGTQQRPFNFNYNIEGFIYGDLDQLYIGYKDLNNLDQLLGFIGSDAEIMPHSRLKKISDEVKNDSEGVEKIGMFLEKIETFDIMENKVSCSFFL